MNFNFILDKFVSNIIVYASYTLMIFIWYYLFYNFGNGINFLLFYFPFGIIILAFLFFGNKIIFGMLLSHITLYFFLKNYKLDLPFDNFFVISACQLLCVPLALIVFQKFNITVGTGKNYSFDKTNIYHVLIITFFSTLFLGILFIFSFFFFYHETNVLNFTLGNFIGALALIILMKITVNVPNLVNILIKGN